jgi:hypothetical protein
MLDLAAMHEAVVVIDDEGIGQDAAKLTRQRIWRGAAAPRSARAGHR